MGKFFLGVLMGGVAGAIAWSKFRKTDYYQQIQEAVQNVKNSSSNSDIEQVVEEIKAKVEDVAAS